ncbi:MAG: hypothetical protein ACOX3S_15735 [Anaerolineae bacterium]|jgi:hypothetical protein
MATTDNYSPTEAYQMELQAAMAAMQHQYNQAALAQAYDQFLKQLDWTKNVDQAQQAYNQQLALGWAQVAPYLNKGKLKLTPMQPTTDAYGLTDPGAGYLPTLEREMAQWGTGLQYANLLASLTGPTDWVRYANVTRGLANSPYPAFMQAVANQAKLPSFQAQTGQTESYEDLWRQAYGGQAYGGQAQSGGASAGNTTGTQASDWRPPPGHRLNAKTLTSLTPVEQQMLQGSVSAAGWNWQDYLLAAQAAAPKGLPMTNTLWAR